MSDLLERVRHRLATGAALLDLGEVAGQESALLLDSAGRSELSGQLAAELTGAGPLEELLAAPGVTDVLVNAPDQVWLDRGGGLERTPVRFDSDAAVRRLATRLAAQAGRRLDDAAPFVDAVLPDGTRLHAILPPLVAHPTLSLRVLARRSLALPELVALGAMPGELADLLAALVQARLTLLISGGTGSGKTTLLAALLATVGSTERIVTVEDTAELVVRHPHVVALLARPANVEGAGAVELRELVRQALRMRADRLVVGEFRGAEIVELLAALNTGHAGGAATVHANSVGDVAARLVALAALGGMPADALATQAASALDVLVHVRRDRDGRRRVEQLAVWPAGPVLAEPGLAWTRSAGLGPAAGQLRTLLEAAEVAVPAMLTGVVPCPG
ncbi:TadA family conjugal transfer-associated ATPase [Jatrophihabitans sp.]|uniref:TadA family conjugal transfer-associated ATPase n=1 Tax=Jatrophihabitans sp. TaxID=1932789 RepID=UPI002BCA9BF1|nr:TadA family conjugal transfer-associated ATPase [Jatrophihabitans sp.]